MAEHGREPDSADDRGVQPPAWARRAVLVLVAVALAVVASQVAAELVPRWWADQVGRLAGGSRPSAVVWGLLMGVVFTMLPLAALLFVRRPGWRLRLGVVVLAVILASPNWLTLAVAVGSGESSREGRRLLAAEADGFITATWVGVALGVVASVVVVAWRLAARRRRAQLRHLREDLAVQHDAETLRREAQERDAAQTRRDLPPDEPQVH